MVKQHHKTLEDDLKAAAEPGCSRHQTSRIGIVRCTERPFKDEIVESRRVPSRGRG
jgi:hypothetical protein